MILSKRYDDIVYVSYIKGDTKKLILYSTNNISTKEYEITNPDTQIAKFKRNGYSEIEHIPRTYNEALSISKDTGTDNNGLVRAQKAHPFEIGRMFLPAYAQRKYNGVRCRSKWTIVDAQDLFTPQDENVKLFNKTGLPFEITHIEKELYLLYSVFYSKAEYYDKIEFDSPEEPLLILDGELYIHGVKVGQINGASVNKDNVNHKDLTYTIFDIVDMLLPQNERIEILEILSNIVRELGLKHIVVTDTILLTKQEDIIKYRDIYIEEDYEGIILRQIDALYQPKRTWDMLKYKQTFFTSLEIIDVVPFGKYPKQGMFVVYDKEYDNTIEVSIAASHVEREVLNNISVKNVK